MSTSTSTAETNTLDGFLVPTSYKYQYAYRSRPVFRCTLLLLIVTIATIGVSAYSWTKANQIKNLANANQAALSNDTNQLALQKANFNNITEKYKELEKLREHLRIPIAPALDAIEKTIPDPIAITKISVNCPPITSVGNSLRKATFTIEVFFPDTINPNDDLYTRWPTELSRHLSPTGLKFSGAEWSAQRRYSSSLQAKIQKPGRDIPGKIKELNFTLELPKF